MRRVKSEMVAEPVFAIVPGSRRQLLELFVRHGHAGLPVVKEGTRKLAGIVTRQDIFEDLEESQVALLMNPNPATSYPEAPVSEAAQLMTERGLRTLPIVNGVNDLVGVLTPAELLAALPSARGHIAPFLRRNVVPVHEGMPVVVALEVFRVTRAAAVPILDDAGRFAGLLTDGALLGGLKFSESVVQSVAGQAQEGDSWDWEAIRSERRVHHATNRMTAPPGPVSNLMLRGVPTAGPNTSVEEAVETMLRHRIHQLPVLNNEGRLLDLVSELDLLAAAVR